MQPPHPETASRRSGVPQRDHTAPLTHTLNAAAQLTGLSRSTLYRHAAAGTLRLVKVGGRTLVDADSLRALVGIAA